MIQLLSSRNERRLFAHRLFALTIASFVLCFVTAIALLPWILSYAKTPVVTGLLSTAFVLLILTLATASLRWISRWVELIPAGGSNSLGRLAIWIVPVAVVSFSTGWVGLLAVGVLTAAMGGRLKQLYRFGPETQKDVVQSAGLPFSSIPQRTANTRFILLTILICVAYIGVAANLAGKHLFAITSTSGSCFLSAWILDARGKAENSKVRHNQAFKFTAHLTIAIALTFLMLLTLRSTSNVGLLGTEARKRQDNDSQKGHLQSGIILFTSRKPVVPIFLPSPQYPARESPRILPHSMSIPFSGEYWFSRWPLLRPPPQSVRETGDPTEFSVSTRSFGHLRILMMQARQNIGRSIDVHCCRSVNVVLRVGDIQPNAVRMELFLIDSSRVDPNSQSLGKRSLQQPAMISPDRSGGLPSETFQFSVPPRSALRSFDSLGVWFHLDPPRAGDSAIVAIERFELVP